MKAKITTSLTKQLIPEEKAYEVADTEIKGFILRVQPTGRKTCYFSYRTIARKRKRIKIGVLGSGLTVAQARDQAQSIAAKYPI
ncbi:Arm DNA-binding domain-containing protein [Teredinibacter waterburyi]|uniref:Arm DNA-binding domain-containing protein n=1 Tax=Teredinibacter waterburyi TaxID=1500538 RepID=UPI00165F4EA0|nr:Arm DNA-binding domain-containing protein [Teredinibacter waterburyi]